MVIYKHNPAGAVRWLTHQLEKRTWIGFAEFDIEIPNHLWPEFEEMCPYFYNKEVPEEAVPQPMKDYMKQTGRNRVSGKKLVEALSAFPRWYVDHGAVVTNLYKTIEYKVAKIFEWFVKEVTEACQTGDVDKSKAMLGDAFKLLGNSAYGKLIEAMERQTNVIYTKDEKVVHRALRSTYFSDLDEIGQSYGLESRKTQM